MATAGRKPEGGERMSFGAKIFLTRFAKSSG